MTFVDPVCRMDVNEAEAAATSTFKGQTYYFCAVMCRDRFAEDPERFVNGQPATDGRSETSAKSRADASENGLQFGISSFQFPETQNVSPRTCGGSEGRRGLSRGKLYGAKG